MIWFILFVLALLVAFVLYAENHNLRMENIQLDRDNADLQRDLAQAGLV